MKFINNWQATLTSDLPIGGDSLPTDTSRLQGGIYRLTVTEGDPTPQSPREIIDVSPGGAIIGRALEGTAEASWPAGSVVYAGLTAGMLDEIIARIEALEEGGDSGDWDAAGGFDADIRADESNDEESQDYFLIWGLDDPVPLASIGEVSLLRFFRYSGDNGYEIEIQAWITNPLGAAEEAQAVKIDIAGIECVAEFWDTQGTGTLEFFGNLTQQQFDSLPKSGTHSVTFSVKW